MITDVLFDLDDTLCDFRGARDAGLAKAIHMLPPEHHQSALNTWNRSESILFRSFADGEITRDEYRYNRFAQLVPNEFDSQVASLVIEMNAAFMGEVNDNIALVDWAMECLRALKSDGFQCHLLTNGPTDGQRRKIDRLGLTPLFGHIQIGESVGVFKPDRRAYDLALEAIGCQASAAVMVGDSLKDDVEGARAAGLSAIHLTKDSPVNGCQSLREVPDAIKAIKGDSL